MWQNPKSKESREEGGKDLRRKVFSEPKFLQLLPRRVRFEQSEQRTALDKGLASHLHPFIHQTLTRTHRTGNCYTPCVPPLC